MCFDRLTARQNRPDSVQSKSSNCIITAYQVMPFINEIYQRKLPLKAPWVVGQNNRKAMELFPLTRGLM